MGARVGPDPAVVRDAILATSTGTGTGTGTGVSGEDSGSASASAGSDDEEFTPGGGTTSPIGTQHAGTSSSSTSTRNLTRRGERGKGSGSGSRDGGVVAKGTVQVGHVVFTPSDADADADADANGGGSVGGSRHQFRYTTDNVVDNMARASTPLEGTHTIHGLPPGRGVGTTAQAEAIHL